MPVERYATHYNMNHPKRGMALIFNQENFDFPSLKPRVGTNIDCENLTNSLQMLHFEVFCYKDLKLHELQKEIEKG